MKNIEAARQLTSACKLCGGNGFTKNGYQCEHCKGVGMLPTALGWELVDFLQSYGALLEKDPGEIAALRLAITPT